MIKKKNDINQNKNYMKNQRQTKWNKKLNAIKTDNCDSK